MTLQIVAGTAGQRLADGITTALGIEAGACVVDRFPDGELRPAVAGIAGADVYVVQPTGPPVAEHVVELLLLLDACRRAGAARVTAVVPYFGYARQDRRSRAGQPVGARVLADAIASTQVHRLVGVDPHTLALEAMCPMPVEMLTAVPLLAQALSTSVPSDAIIVAPDLGAAKLAEHYASLLHTRVALVRKSRESGARVRAEELVGAVAGAPAVVVDDMISTGGTVSAAVEILLDHGSAPDVAVAATHGLLIGPATDRLSALPIQRVVVTNSTGQQQNTMPILEVHSIAPLLADAIGRLHRGEPLDELLVHT
ncbi:ribose-phosphate diphosphokinase [Actinopolymorpha sp. NPDC004070]|uniref:ribose-phosphate diphosphokinase n=1 Tax=Actinopolymorpha sp. NPDC004070 TaxID=3154548 RepID=UPI0033A25CD0